jgi:hypothetical protein
LAERREAEFSRLPTQSSQRWLTNRDRKKPVGLTLERRPSKFEPGTTHAIPRQPALRHVDVTEAKCANLSKA